MNIKVAAFTVSEKSSNTHESSRPSKHGSKDVGGIKSVTNGRKDKPKAIYMPSIFLTLVWYCVQMVQSYIVIGLYYLAFCLL